MYLSKGFTLIELMIAVSIAVLLVTVAIPSFNSTMLRAENTAVSNTLTSSIHFSRNEAITRNSRVTLCPSVDGIQCDTSSNQWNQGWIATWVSDTGTTEILRYWPINSTKNLISLTSLNTTDSVIFTAQGDIFLTSLATASQHTDVVFTFQNANCKTGEQEQRVITVAPYGSVTVDKIACS